MEKEESIRKGVSNFFTERILNVIKSKPSINDELNNAVIIVANKTIDKLVIKGKKTIEDAYQNEQFFKNNPQGPTYLVRHIQGIQDEWLGGRKSYEIGYLKNMNQLKEDKINIPTFEESCIEILYYITKQDNVFKSSSYYNFD
ncbi:MAG: hypothetical protein L6266_05525, partial [Nanoarchaeota archaeon]|nr:hypothetical protein [Nanoarchaeota archaeon]